MTLRGEAEELVSLFMDYTPTKLSDYTKIYSPSAIQFALISVDRVIQVLEGLNADLALPELTRYRQIKQELSLL